MQPYKHEKFGDPIPYAEPAWYQGQPTPYYAPKHAAWRNKVRAFVDKELAPFATEWDEGKSFPVHEVRRKAYEAGVLAPWAPRELGGTPPEGGWDEFMNVIWIDELSRCGAAGVVVCVFFILYMSLPHTIKYGSDALKKYVAPRLLRGEGGMSITLTEPEGGSDLANLTTTAVKSPDGSHYIVNGVKKFITGGEFATFFSTAVRTSGPGVGGVSLLVIEKDLPGVTVKKLEAQGWWSGNTCLVTFEDVKVKASNLIGREGRGFAYLVDVMNGERLIAVASAIRGARTCLSEGIKFAQQRVTFGKKLIQHQVIRHKIANMAILVEAAQSSLDTIVFAMTNGAKPMDVGGPMALAKVQATRAMEYCCREASQILGGASYLRQGKGQTVERIAREVRVAVVGGGSEEILLDLAMRQAKL